MSERIYKMTRLGPGDYLLPSNDAQTLWRICTTEEDWAGETVKGWAIWRWRGSGLGRVSFPDIDDLAFAMAQNDWSVWEYWAGPFQKRSAAIEAALRVA